MEFLGESEPLSVLAKRQFPPVAPENGLLQESEREPLVEVPEKPLMRSANLVESYLQTEASAAALAVPGTSFEGPGTGIVGFTMTGAPPDANLAVGPNHIVAMVNTQYVVFDKSGAILVGPINGNALFSGVGGLCETSNRGDPILQYDRLADRWILSQFAFTSVGNGPQAPYLQCIAVSTSGSPTGTYYRYSVAFGSVNPDGFNDYGKLGIWNDGYYTSYNVFGGSPSTDNNTGVALCVSDRAKMLVGSASATTLCAPTTFYANGASFLPADLDGTTLPTDTTRGGLFLRQSIVPALRYLRLKPNFSAGTATLTDGFGGATGSYVQLPLGTTTRACYGDGGNCIAQPGTSIQLDTVGDRVMYRLAYRNRGGVDSLVLTQSVDPDGSGSRGSAVRWYEIRNPLGNPSDTDTSKRPFVYESGTYDPGASGDRWMGSAAMDKYGNILIGYSYADAAAGIRPSIAVAGHSQADVLNTLGAEQVAVQGSGSQIGSLHRWGDYSTMQVDPADDTTFWYIGEYLTADGTFNWQTRIVSYRFATTTAIADGDLNAAGNWTNGVPSSTVTGIVPSGMIMTVNSPTTIGNLEVQTGSSVLLNADLTVTGALTLGGSVNAGVNSLKLGCNSTVSGAGSSAYVIGDVKKDFCAVGGFSFPVGTASGYSPVYVNVTTLAATPSTLEVKPVEAFHTGMNTAQSLKRYWTLALVGSLTGNFTFNYLDGDVNGTESSYLLYKWNGGSATRVPYTLSTGANTLTATGISSFSDWTAGALAPTAGEVSVSGRILTAGGNGVPNAVVTIRDAAGNTRSRAASPFGYFRFDDIESGQTYIVTASAKGSTFSPIPVEVNGPVNELQIKAN
jgi:hypothetical protein